MTRETARREIEFLDYYLQNHTDGYGEESHRAMMMAVEVLEQEPCKDCVSRKAVLEQTYDWSKDEFLRVTNPFDYLRKRINSLPSANTEQKTGHWIMPTQDDGMSDPIYYQVRCSECEFDLNPQTWYQELHQCGGDKYCPNCGARMEGVRNKDEWRKL